MFLPSTQGVALCSQIPTAALNEVNLYLITHLADQRDLGHAGLLKICFIDSVLHKSQRCFRHLFNFRENDKTGESQGVGELYP